MHLEDIIPLGKPIHVADIGAALINERPLYEHLLSRGLARLSAFDGDDRHKEALERAYGDSMKFYGDIIADGKPHKLYLAAADTGMSSILKPSPPALSFFNGFSGFGFVQREIPVRSKKLDDVEGLEAIDFLKMDIQGAELMALKGGRRTLRNCVAVQLEVAFFPLYEKQPSFGEVDVYMRSIGFAPHCFIEVKRWSIAPTVRDGNVRAPFNQLMEADILYVRDPLRVDAMNVDAVRNLAFIAWYCYNSPDLAAYLLLELERRGAAPQGSAQKLPLLGK